MSSDESSELRRSARAPRRRPREGAAGACPAVAGARDRAATIVTSVIAVVAIAAVVVTWVVSSAASRPLLKPANVTNDGFKVTEVTGVGIMTDTSGSATPSATPTPEATADPSATPTDRPAVDIRVYVDYLSTGSRDFQLANVQQLAEWVSQDAATVSYYPVAMLTAKSNGTKYSLRAASAAACVATYSPDNFFAFNNALLTQQPDVESDGLTDSQLAALAIASGADDPKVVRECIEDQAFATWAKDATDRALKGLADTDNVALTGTPMILVNGSPYVGALDDPKEFAQFVLTIASDAYYKETGATPTPTPTATP